jgi:glutamate mutase epsilon subunit
MHAYIEQARRAGELVVQPRMGMVTAEAMGQGLAAVRAADARTVGTMTLDSYTRVGDHDGARRALRQGEALNGFPIVAHGPAVASEVAGSAGLEMPVQVRHGSSRPEAIFSTMSQAGLSVSEGGPVSYCLPYGRVPLVQSVASWRTASAQLASDSAAQGLRAHLETFGGCLLGQLCPPSLLIAMSVLEAMFFAQQGVLSVSLSYAQQTHPGQDVEALGAMRELAARLLPCTVDWHVVLYTYMGVFPRTEAGAARLLDRSVHVAVRGGAERLIVKTTAEAHRIPTVAENVTALEQAAAVALEARTVSVLPWASEVDFGEVFTEAHALIEAVLEHSDDVGQALLHAFAVGVLDVPYCLHDDNHGDSQGVIDHDGRLRWARVGAMPLPSAHKGSSRVRSSQLLSMLRYTSDQHDQQAAAEAAGPCPVPLSPRPPPHRVAVVGTGPRGLAILERMTARLAAHPPVDPVELSAIDAVEVGCGRVWRTDQSDCFLMNTPAGEVTMFSGPADAGPARPGAGPTLAQWWQAEDPDCPGPDGYAPRVVYGRYLRFVLDTVTTSLPDRVQLRRIHARVDDLVRPGREHAGEGRYRLTLATGEELDADRVVLATGHPTPELIGAQRELADFAMERPHLQYLPGDSPADMPLEQIVAGSMVGVLGMGLSFYDVMAALTTARGGRFVNDGASGLRYEASGHEPVLVAGSRSGIPLPARGRNQKSTEYSYTPHLFTSERISELRRQHEQLDFRTQVLPWLLAEIQLIYCATTIRAAAGVDAAEVFTETAVMRAVGSEHPARTVIADAHRFGFTETASLDLETLARPFAGRQFAGPDEVRDAIRDWLSTDLGLADLGNVDGPLKASLDVLRDTRNVLRGAVDFAGLTPDSHQEFLAWFGPIASLLAAGPPRRRLRQTTALIEAGVLRLLGPGATFCSDSRTGRFTAAASSVTGAPTLLDAVIDARIPTPDLRRDPASLTRRLYTAGVLTSYINRGAGAAYDTGGVAVTAAPFHPIAADGRCDDGLYVLGIPTEHTRWFTQVGSSRPGKWGEFMADADAIAAHALTSHAATGTRTALFTTSTRAERALTKAS